MSVPLKATSYHTTEHLLELALTMLENARREQNTDQLPANNWLTNNFTLEIIRAKVAANKAERYPQAGPAGGCGALTMANTLKNRNL